MLLTDFLLPGITVEFEYLDLTMTEVRCIALHGIMRGWCIRATGKKQTTRRRKKNESSFHKASQDTSNPRYV